MQRSTKIVIASLFLVMIVALGGLAAVAVGTGEGLNNLFTQNSGRTHQIEQAAAVSANEQSSAAVAGRPYLGISYIGISPEVAAYYGLSRQDGIYVSEVAASSPAERAGITPNSIITRFDGTTVDSNTALVQLLMKYKVGDSLELSLVTPDGKIETTVSVVLSARPGGQ